MTVDDELVCDDDDYDYLEDEDKGGSYFMMHCS